MRHFLDPVAAAGLNLSQEHRSHLEMAQKPLGEPHEMDERQVGEGLLGVLRKLAVDADKIYHGAASSATKIQGDEVGMWSSKRPLPAVQDFRVIESNIIEPEASWFSSTNSLASTVSASEGSRTSSAEASDAALPPMRLSPELPVRRKTLPMHMSPELPVRRKSSTNREPAKSTCEECSSEDSIAYPGGECQICGASAKGHLDHLSVAFNCDNCSAVKSMVALHSGMHTCQVHASRILHVQTCE
jgi:hypothetical protein